MRRRKYDFVLGLGPACSCSQSLRAAGLQLTSLPFDWNGMHSLGCRRRMLETNFAEQLRREDFKLIPESEIGVSHYWFNTRYDCVFAHDFLGNNFSDAELEAVKAKYRRRIERCDRLIASSRRVLIVWLQIANYPVPQQSEFVELRQWAEHKWPEVSFDMLFFRWKEGLPQAEAEEEESDGVRMVSFDYRDRSQERWFADHDMVGLWLKRRYAVRDYRTEAEKQAWRRGEREKKFAKFGVHNWPAYFFARATYALKKHFAKAKGKA